MLDDSIYDMNKVVELGKRACQVGVESPEELEVMARSFHAGRLQYSLMRRYVTQVLDEYGKRTGFSCEVDTRPEEG